MAETLLGRGLNTGQAATYPFNQLDLGPAILVNAERTGKCQYTGNTFIDRIYLRQPSSSLLSSQSFFQSHTWESDIHCPLAQRNSPEWHSGMKIHGFRTVLFSAPCSVCGRARGMAKLHQMALKRMPIPAALSYLGY